jgi:hypothetical protein
MIRVWLAYRSNFEETKEFQRQAKEVISKGYIRENMSLCVILVLLADANFSYQ